MNKVNEHLNNILHYYALHQSGEEVDKEEFYINDALNVIEIIKRIVNDDSNYFNADYAEGSKIYIDGCTEYLSEEEKSLINRFFKKVKIDD